MLNTFADVEIRLDPQLPHRFHFTPFGELDWIDLPAPIERFEHITGPHNGRIEFTCLDGLVYELGGGSPNHIDTWRVRELRAA